MTSDEFIITLYDKKGNPLQSSRIVGTLAEAKNKAQWLLCKNYIYSACVHSQSVFCGRQKVEDPNDLAGWYLTDWVNV